MTLEKNDFTKSHLAPPNLAQIIIWNLENLEFPSFSWFLGHTRLDFRDSESIQGQIYLLLRPIELTLEKNDFTKSPLIWPKYLFGTLKIWNFLHFHGFYVIQGRILETLNLYKDGITDF